MLFQVDISSIEWILGLGLMFGLAFIMTYFTSKDLHTFMVFLTLFSGFIVYMDLLPLWVLIVNLIVLTLIIGYQLKNRSNVT